MCPPGLPDLTDDECMTMFEMIDIDHSGKISYREMCKFVRDCLDADDKEGKAFKNAKKKE